ncbi:MAG: aconitase X catalytic domain-containing protein [Methanomassiliicoccales archaeon]|nr:MAG: aconitase X catalytic domain-containing protein [Methanomassiliicoccales archaeon]
MYLTKEEESVLAGEQGESKRMAMELLVALGKIYDAKRLVPITSAHLSGVSYKTIGEGGLEFLKEVSKGTKVCVKTTLNPAGMDRDRWKEMGVDRSFAEKQLEIIGYYSQMGVETNCTCTPYLAGNSPSKGERIAWAESSALSFANSILGARTNREGGPGALAAAIIGKTPEYGLHLEENRQPTVVIEAEPRDEIFDYSLLGQAVGLKLGASIPFFKGIRPNINEIKIMAAAMAAAGSVALFHIENMTPESKNMDIGGLERVQIDRKELDEMRARLTTSKEPDLIALGCPHLSETEMKTLAKYLDGRKKRKDIEIWFCTSRRVKTWCPKETAVLERFGKVVTDTCMVVAPIEKNHKVTASNSCKACNYLPGLCSQKCLCEDAFSLLELVM